MSMKWFCPFCWKEIEEKAIFCPFCQGNLEKFQSLSFEEKLLLGLKSPICQNRMFVIKTLGRIKSEKAVKPLCEHLNAPVDPYEIMETLKALKLIGSKEAEECIENFLKTCNMKIVLKFAREELKVK